MKLWPLENTVFDREIAEKLAADCYRTHSPGPWAKNDKVQELLEGLWWAEVGHFKGSLMDGGGPAQRELVAKLKAKGGFGTKMRAAANEWEKLSDGARLFFAETMKSAGELGDPDEIAKRIERFMWACLCTEDILLGSSIGKPSRGPIPRLKGLKKFVDRLKVVWERNDLGEVFSADFDPLTHNPISSAAKLVCYSAALIDPRYGPETCDQIMRPR